MRWITLTLVSLLAAIAVTACTRKQETARPQVKVSATKAYEQFFGSAPTTDKGSCYAFVIYFPSGKEPGKLVPFPFFTFDAASLKKVAVQRLVGGIVDLKAYQGEIRQPFPANVRLLDLSEKEGTVTVNFGPELAAIEGDAAAARGAAGAVALTLKQFDGVREVRLLVDGKEGALNALAGKADSAAVLPLPPPRLLSLTAMKERGATRVEEVDAFFDRPVEIKSLQLVTGEGKAIPGDIYQSVFDMAGVLKPGEPEAFKEGMPVRVRFSVTDKLGRSASGDSVVSLEVREH